MELSRWIAPVAERADDHMPRVIPPMMHAAIDVAFAAGTLYFAYKNWNRNRRAAVSALMAGVMEVGLIASTNYRGGASKRISFPLHGRLALGHAAMLRSM